MWHADCQFRVCALTGRAGLRSAALDTDIRPGPVGARPVSARAPGRGDTTSCAVCWLQLELTGHCRAAPAESEQSGESSPAAQCRPDRRRTDGRTALRAALCLGLAPLAAARRQTPCGSVWLRAAPARGKPGRTSWYAVHVIGSAPLLLARRGAAPHVQPRTCDSWRTCGSRGASLCTGTPRRRYVKVLRAEMPAPACADVLSRRAM